MLKNRGVDDNTGMLGSVGDDFYGQLYSELLSKEDIVPIFEKIEKTNTGICCVFCHNRDRGHITDLGASTQISPEFVQRVWEELSKVELIYTELFILKHRKDIVYMLAEHCEHINRVFGFNLPSHYFLETYFEDIKNLIEYADIFFANAAEAQFFGNLMGLEVKNTINKQLKKTFNSQMVDDLSELCLNFVKLPKKNKSKKRVAVITSGPNPAYVAEYDFSKEQLTFFGSYSPVPVDESLIIDTNGAGDAFAGGFLSQYMKNESLEKCMKAGHWAASVIIQERGCMIPDDVSFKEL